MATIREVRQTSCCGMQELEDFLTHSGEVKVSEEEWLEALSVTYYHYSDSDYDPDMASIILFSGASYQRGERGSPFEFAGYLKAKGEKVVMSPSRHNKNSGHFVQAFLWTPSKDWRDNFYKFYKKKYKEEHERESSRSGYYW